MPPDPTYPKRPAQLGDRGFPYWPLGPVDFTDPLLPPVGYRCLICDTWGVRLWREYNCIATYNITLHCFDCAILKAGDIVKPYDFQKGRHYTPDDGKISGLVGAVPTAEGDTFWGYGALPMDGVAWWRGLKPRRDEDWSREDALEAQLRAYRQGHADLSRLHGYDRKLLDAWVARGNDLEKRLRKLGVELEDWRPLR